jgi:hypothetical protein
MYFIYMYENGPTKPVQVVLRSGEWRMRENDRGVNLTNSHCKHI